MNGNILRSCVTVLAAVATVAVVAVGESWSAPGRIRLTIDRDEVGNLDLGWQDFCPQTETDYAVYEGSLGDFTSHTSILCSTGETTSANVPLPSGDSYYLVVPLEAGAEGTYGQDSDGGERPVGLGACTAQQVVITCPDDDFLQASPERLARLDEVMDAAIAILDGGGTYTDAASMLGGEGDVDGVWSDGISLFFNVDGLPTSIYDGAVARHEDPPHEVIPPPAPTGAGSSGAETSHLEGELLTADFASLALPRGQRMVGKDDDGDGFRDLPKHALVLSPWAFDFIPNDSAPGVVAILESVRDYQEGSVTFKDNTVGPSSNAFKVADYIDGWESQDVIFISSHGSINPNAGPNSVSRGEPYVYLGIIDQTCAGVRAKVEAEFPDEDTRPRGLGCGTITYRDAANNTVRVRDARGTVTFWENHHPGGLDKKLIYLDSCRSGAGVGLAESLVGTDSIFFGWSDTVGATASVSTATSVFDEALLNAYPALRAFVHACSGGTCTDTQPDSELLVAWHRADLRTREALSISGTPVTGFCGESPTQPVELTCPSCGGVLGMSLNYDITLEGVEAEDLVLLPDPLEFGMYQLRLFADVDGVESGYAMALLDSNMVPAGNGAYTAGVMLWADDICPWQVFEYNPWVLLPTFDESMSANGQRDRIYSWDGPFTIQIIPTPLP